MKKLFIALSFIINLIIVLMFLSACSNPFWPQRKKETIDPTVLSGLNVISSVNVNITAPVKGEQPTTTADTDDELYTCGEVLWDPPHKPFCGKEPYTASVTLTANPNSTFTGLSTADINGETAEIIDNTGDTVTISYNFAEIFAETVVGMKIDPQPNKLVYIHGESLNLEGIVIEIMFKDHTDGTIPLDDFKKYKIRTIPENGAELSHTDHNGEHIKVFFGKYKEMAGELKVKKAPIMNAALTVVAPTTGAKPDTDAETTDATKFDLSEVSWSPNHDPFQAGIKYTASVKLTAKNDYTFTGGLDENQVTINEQKAEIKIDENTGETAVLSYEFEPSKNLTRISITTELTKSDYIHGDLLDLEGLVVTKGFDDGTSEDIPLVDFDKYNITSIPENGAILSHSTHDNQRVVVSFGGLTAETCTLKVNKVPIVNAAITVATPTTGTEPSTTAEVAGVPNFTVDPVLWTPTPSDNKFLGKMKYTASVMLTAAENYTFNGGLAEDHVTINNQKAEIRENTGETVVLSYEFEETSEPKAIEITATLTKLEYIHGDMLNLTGLKVTVIFEDDTEAYYTPENFGANITTSPANDSVLSHTTHDGKPVVVTFGKISKSTDNLTVNPKQLAVQLSSNVLSPINTVTTVEIIGLVGGDSVASSVKSPISGISFNSSTNKLTYNGTTSFPNPNVNIEFTMNAGANYKPPADALTINVFDGQADYSGATGTFDRRIPVNQKNITTFNTYTTDNGTRGDGLKRHYKLTENITLTGTTGSNWTAIGTVSGSTGYPFTGIFDGQGYTISKLTINNALENQGMFGYISGNIEVKVKNLGLLDVSITSTNNNVGGIVGYNKGASIQNCYVSGSIKGNLYVGGVVGKNMSDESGDGSKNNSIIQNCYVTGIVKATESRVGGIAGFSLDYIKNCVVLSPEISKIPDGNSTIGKVTGASSFPGKLVNNYGRNNMSLTYNAGKSSVPVTSSASGIHGQTITSVNYNDQTWWKNTAGWDFTKVWEWDGNLPKLRTPAKP